MIKVEAFKIIVNKSDIIKLEKELKNKNVIKVSLESGDVYVIYKHKAQEVFIWPTSWLGYSSHKDGYYLKSYSSNLIQSYTELILKLNKDKQFFDQTNIIYEIDESK